MRVHFSDTVLIYKKRETQKSHKLLRRCSFSGGGPSLSLSLSQEAGAMPDSVCCECREEASLARFICVCRVENGPVVPDVSLPLLGPKTGCWPAGLEFNPQTHYLYHANGMKSLILPVILLI